MLTSTEKKDAILRMIEQIRQMMARLMERGRDGGGVDDALRETNAAAAGLLGPLASVAPRLDSATAAHMVADADALGGWAELTAFEAGLHRQAGNEGAGRAAARRALELALEAHLRTPADRAGLLALIDRLRPRVDESSLGSRYTNALAALPKRRPGSAGS
jgi:hypothetical protein